MQKYSYYQNWPRPWERHCFILFESDLTGLPAAVAAINW